ncbi:hypothetical protein [Nocardia otitidiscaviarum]|uniref:hypothetical protein n=1 Tax=Nocardia otitidiscaviarum TaxID=1823 RepID=UPI000AE311B6|nr:hypothetical protein [Nocardia otitidiscaviarum]
MTDTRIRVHQWRTPILKARRARGAVDRIVVDPDVYARLDGRARDALLAVELTLADHARRSAHTAAPARPAPTRQLDLLLSRSGTGGPDTVVSGVLLAAAAGAAVPIPGGGLARLVLFAVVVAAVLWAFDAALERGVYLRADRAAARLVGADAVRYMLMTVQADEPHRRGLAAWRTRWLGYRPTVRRRLASLHRAFPAQEMSP